MRYLKERALSPPLQLYGLNRHFQQGSGSVQKGRLKWEQAVRPTPLSREYLVRIVYRLGFQPQVFVLKPSLRELSSGRTIPHLYSQEKEKLCLYMPKYKEWQPNDQLALTIVPWIFSWLFYFEEWLASDEWKGGGEHPRSENADEKS